MDIKNSINLREKTLEICQRFAEFANVIHYTIFSHIVIIFKLGARGRRPRTPGFLKLLLFARRYACVCVCVLVSVCVSAPEAINNQWHDTV